MMAKKTSNSAYAQCCYCGRNVAFSRQTRHQEICIEGPTGKTLRGFLRKHARGDLIMQKQEYMHSDERKRLGLPDGTTLVRWFGTWDDVAAWCGLHYVRYAAKTRNDKLDIPTRSNNSYAAALESAYDFRSISAIDRGVKRYYDPQRMCYYTARVMELK